MASKARRRAAWGTANTADHRRRDERARGNRGRAALHARPHALGRPRSAGRLHQLERVRDAARAARAFAGKRLEDFSQDELAAIRAGAEQEAIDGLAPGPRGPDDWWLQNLDLKKRRQPWLIVDPPDGRVPPLTANGRRRAQAAGRVKSSFLGGPFNSPADFGLLERCISRGVPGSMIPVMYGNNYQIFQTPGYVVITYEIIHEARVIPLDGRPHVGASHPLVHGRRARPLGGRHAGGRNHQLHAPRAYRNADPRR